MERWVIKNRTADFNQISQSCGISEVLARCLVNKGIAEPDQIKDYLYPGLERLHSPQSMKGMEKAVAILADKIQSGNKIRIIGDYDVDGVVATYVLYRTLNKLGAKVDYIIPDRIKDGYGINIRMVEDAHHEQVDTLLTCDNGIVAMEQVQRAKEYHMTVIITDHHNLALNEEGEELLPPADTILNPKQSGCTYPFQGLCGAAIAYKLITALLCYLDIADRETYLEEMLSYVAIATVCDVMELVDENRIIVKHGLSILRNTTNQGLLALMEVCQVEREHLSAFHLGFIIGPCLNASGRLDTANRGLELLLSQSPQEAIKLANEVKSLNDVRKDMTVQNVEKAVTLIEDSALREDKVLVVFIQECHESIAGIIAGRIRERYNKPTIVLTEGEECVKGSGRSIEAYNMIAELSKCKELLLKCGGHPMAAGLSLLSENIDALRQRLNHNTALTDEMLIPKISIDILLPFGYVTEKLIEELKLLEPYGKGNERPLFAEKNVRIKSAFILGKNASGIKLYMQNQYNRPMEGIYFGDVEGFFRYISDTYGQEEAERLKTGRSMQALLTITYTPKISEYNGFRSIQLMIQNYR